VVRVGLLTTIKCHNKEDVMEKPIDIQAYDYEAGKMKLTIAADEVRVKASSRTDFALLERQLKFVEQVVAQADSQFTLRGEVWCKRTTGKLTAAMYVGTKKTKTLYRYFEEA
jgi:hypothetical protein